MNRVFVAIFHCIAPSLIQFKCSIFVFNWQTHREKGNEGGKREIRYGIPYM